MPKLGLFEDDDDETLERRATWISPVEVLKSAVPQLVPFFKTCCIFFVVWLPQDPPSVAAALLKVMPITCLCIFVARQGVSFESRHDYNRRIFVGLILSAIGDVLLVWCKTCFEIGLLSFLLAHLAYLWAFGCRSLQPLKAVVPVFLAAATYLHILPGLQGSLIVFTALYSIILGATLWRGLAQVNLRKNRWSWTALCASLGMVFFSFSDILLAVDVFLVSYPTSRGLIMSSYYTAQCFITLSTFNNDHLISLAMSKEK